MKSKENNKMGALYFGDPKKGAMNCVKISRPNRLQRFLLRKLLNLYYYE